MKKFLQLIFLLFLVSAQANAAPTNNPVPGTLSVTVSNTALHLVNSQTNFFVANSNDVYRAIAGAISGAGNAGTNTGIIALGIATLSNGSNKVSTVFSNSTNVYSLTYRTRDGNASAVWLANIVDNSSFTIFSAKPSDTNQVDWTIFKP